MLKGKAAGLNFTARRKRHAAECQRCALSELDARPQLAEIQLIAVAETGRREIERAGAEAARTDGVGGKILEANVIERAAHVEPRSLDEDAELRAIADEGVVGIAVRDRSAAPADRPPAGNTTRTRRG
jgi:hypothetical protein